MKWSFLLLILLQISKFLQLLDVDGLWIDMNEISNFCNGECGNGDSNSGGSRRLPGYPASFDPNNPPYKINNQGNRVALNVKTLDMDAQHHGGVLEYNAHNLFGKRQDFRSCLMIDLGRETDGNNEICLGVRFALCLRGKMVTLLVQVGKFVAYMILPCGCLCL